MVSRRPSSPLRDPYLKDPVERVSCPKTAHAGGSEASTHPGALSRGLRGGAAGS